MRTPWSVAALLAVGIASLGCSGQQGAATRPSGPPPPVAGPDLPAAPTGPAAWSLDLANLRHPDRPATGRVHGQDFKPDQVKLEGNILTFRQGKQFFADREIKIFLWAEVESLAQGFHVEVRPNVTTATQVPMVQLSWMEGGGLPKDEGFSSKYAMKLELAKPDGRKLPGTVYVCLPDAGHSFLAGSFTADAPDLVGTKVHGQIAPKGSGDLQLAVGYVGSTANGEVKSGYAGTKVAPGVSVLSAGTKLAFDAKGGCTYGAFGVPPGTYLFFAALNDRTLGWKWVAVHDENDLSVDLAVDQEGLGTLDVHLPPKSKERKLYLLPLDAAGKLPALKAPADAVALQLGAFVKGLAGEAKAGTDQVSFAGLKAGTYRVVAGPASADATVKSGQTAKVELSVKH